MSFSLSYMDPFKNKWLTVPQIVSLSVREVAPSASMGHPLDGDTNVCAGVL